MCSFVHLKAVLCKHLLEMQKDTAINTHYHWEISRKIKGTVISLIYSTNPICHTKTLRIIGLSLQVLMF